MRPPLSACRPRMLRPVCLAVALGMGRRSVGTSAFANVARMPLLEELLEAPVLKAGALDAEKLALISEYTPPVLRRQLEASLSHEFGRHIVCTDWSRYTDPFKESQVEQAARLLQMTLATIGRATAKSYRRGLPKGTGRRNEEWIRTECTRMLQEMEEGSVQRWTAPPSLVGRAQWRSLSEAQKNALMPAIILVSKNPHLHPRLKQQVLSHILPIIKTTIK